jgi:thioredoxin 1
MNDSSESPVVRVNAQNFQDEVLGAKTPVLIDVTAAWCPPCRAAAPVVRALSAQYAGRLKVVEVDGDESPELVARLGVRGFPTFIGYDAGKPRQRMAGFGGRLALLKLAQALVGEELVAG